jgi:radical SAM superfamily enzyme YgiQ (UPF0313 family)
MGNRIRVVLVGFEDQENLGLRYLSSSLRQAGHETRLVTITDGAEPLLQVIRDFQPIVVGFSLIFQYLVPHFATLLQRLRAEGVSAHFTMGGHYPSFQPKALLEAIPELDSVVRFEGEDTLLALTESIAHALPWQSLPGIAFRGQEAMVVNPTRAGRQELDTLPWPDRDDIQYDRQQLPTASVLGGRGCPWRCSFCSIITFYEGNGTKGRRRRDPVLIADELEYLHRERGVRIILWQDDDFLAGGRKGMTWAHAIAQECIRRGLDRNLRWKISCRPDEVTTESLEPLVAAGLTHIYMGVESGDPQNLKNLNKLLKPESHFKAGEIIRQLGLSFDFGFMLLEPWSTFATVRNNIRFLREFAGDGASAVSFCRTLPYAGTALEERLIEEGRLQDQGVNADYRFLDPRLDVYYDWLLSTFAERHSTASGTSNLLRLLLFDAHLNLPEHPRDPQFKQWAWHLTSIANRVLLDTIEAGLDHIESREAVEPNDSILSMLGEHQSREDQRLRGDVALLLQRRPDIQQHLHLMR